MAKWLLVSHFVVSALAASEAQLKFVPVPIEKRIEVKRTVEASRSSPSASSHHATVVPISNSSIRVTPLDITGLPSTRGFSRAITASDHSHDPGRLHVAASYQHPHRGDRSNSRFGHDYRSGYNNNLEEHSRNFRGLQTPRVDVDLHGSHYPGPAYRHHQGQGNSFRENRVEVRIDDFRRDQTQNFQTLQNRPQDFHGTHQTQRPLDSDVRAGGWQPSRDFRQQDREIRQQDRVFGQQDRGFGQQDRGFSQLDRGFSQQDRGLGQQDREFRQQDRDFRQHDRDYQKQDRDYRGQQGGYQRDQGSFGDRRDDSRQSFRPGEGQSQSCGPQSPCLEPNGLFPVDGNCCGFVNCANCRPYTQRCAAGTVFDLDLWICNHERDTQQCAGNNRECAFQQPNLRGQSQDYDTQDDGPSVRGHDGSIRGSSSDHGWEYASASEVKEVKKKTGKVPRVKKVVKAKKA